ncbi:MAG: RNB domain-containing ribonuclease [Methanomicrobiales archaeon]|nr:RNB domain-containing ribonuclease [Methanomicrobiales archaeon]
MRDDPTIDLSAIARDAMQKYGFHPGFPASVVREVDALSGEVPSAGDTALRDLRACLWSSIDNIDSLDLDQIEYCEPGPDGEIHVRVAIADVDFFVPKASATDRHAAHNGTSVYTGVVTFPMLPDRLSKGMSSLLPGQDARAIVIEYTVLPGGDVARGQLYRAVVANKAKLVYEEVGDWLDGKGPAPALVRDVPGLQEQIHLQTEAVIRLRNRRMEQGALDLRTIEASPVMEEGAVRDLVVQEENTARFIIEEFMIAANGTMVAYLGTAGVPMIQRVVRTPKYWEEIVSTAASYGETLPLEPDSKALSRFLTRQRTADPERFPDLSLTVVKLMGPGEYVMLEPGEPPFGHFGLAVTDYTHGTAPNRRYVDLVNQRMIKAVIEGDEPPYDADELAMLAEWLSGREKASQKVERFMRKAAAAVLLQGRIGETFEAFVTGASEKGTYVRLVAPPAEGRVMQGEHGLRVGMRVRVRLIRTDPYNAFIDFACTGRLPG